MKRLLRLALRTGMRKGWRSGMVDGNRTWVVVGGIALIGHLAGRALARDEETVFSEVLKPGETFRYTSGCPLSTSSGIMAGSYRVVDEDGSVFDVAIPTFSLDSPFTRRILN